MTSRISIKRNGELLREVPLEGELLLGRHPSVDLQLEDPMISREHARVVVQDGQVAILDKNSVNGLKLNGVRVTAGQPAPLQDGDVVQIASFELTFHLPEPELETRRVDLPPAGEQTSRLPATAAPEPVPSASPNLEHLLEEGIPVWRDNQEVELEVADIIEETHDVKTYRLKGKEPMLFSYKPGQFVTLKLEIDGKPVTRLYSISSSPSRPHTLEVTIKRVPGGLVSNWMYESIKLGDTIRVQGPNGDFSCFNYPSRKILCIAAGSGITPVMSMCRWIVDTTADVDVILLVSARSPGDIIFRKELELMSARHSGLQVYVTVTSGWTGTEAWTGLTGRLCSQMLQMTVPDLHERHIYMCGPNPFMEAARACLKTLEFPTQNMHSESFGPARVAPASRVAERDVPHPRAAAVPAAAAPAQPAAPAAPPTGFAVQFSGSGVSVHTDGVGCLLDLAEANGVAITPGCRMGSCLMCKVKKVSGEVRMDDNMLPEDQKAAGYVLTCVGHPESDVVLDV